MFVRIKDNVFSLFSFKQVCGNDFDLHLISTCYGIPEIPTKYANILYLVCSHIYYISFYFIAGPSLLFLPCLIGFLIELLLNKYPFGLPKYLHGVI
jgi:hypothetical protein